MTAALWTGPAADPRRYRVELVDDVPVAEPGHGADGVVYRAFSSYRSASGEERAVAIKLKPLLRLRDVSELDRRADVLRQLVHPGLMRAVEAFVGTALTDADPDTLEDDDFDLVWVVTEWIDGERLTEVTMEDPARSLHLVAEIARGVEFMHRIRDPAAAPDGIAHRDIKTSNIRVRPDGAPVVIDYGSAGPVDEVWVPDGTPGWLAPEVAGGGPARMAADAWGVGAIAHDLLCGRPPALDGAACSLERLRGAVRHSDLPNAEAVVVHVTALLEGDPSKRPDDLADWADRLDGLVCGSVAARRRRLIGAGLAAAAIAVAIVGFAIVRPWADDADDSGTARAGAPNCRDAGVSSGTPEGRLLRRAIDDLGTTRCVENVDRFDEALVARLTTTKGVPAGVLMASPGQPVIPLTEGQFTSYRQLAGSTRPENATLVGGYPASVRTQTQPVAVIVELSRGGLLIGRRADTQMFWIPLEGRSLWESAGGLSGRFGFPASNPYLSGSGLRQDFERGYLTTSIVPITAPASGGLPYGFGEVVPNDAPDAGAELSRLGDLRDRILQQEGPVRWFVDDHLVRHWIPNDEVYECIGEDRTVEGNVTGTAIFTLELGAPATCAMAR